MIQLLRPLAGLANSQEKRAAEENAFRARHQLIAWDRVGAFSVNGENFRHAIRHRMERWPAQEVLRETDGPCPHMKRKIFDEVNFRDAHPTHSSTRQVGVEPLPVAWESEGAASASQHELRMMDEKRSWNVLGPIHISRSGSRQGEEFGAPRTEDWGASAAHAKWRGNQLCKICDQYTSGAAEDNGAGIAKFPACRGTSRTSPQDEPRRIAWSVFHGLS